MSERRRTILMALTAWAGVALLEATVVHAQEGTPFGFALLGAAVNFGVLGLVAIPLWRLYRRRLENPRGPLVTALWHAAVAACAILAWQGGALGLFYLTAGPEAVRYATSSGLWYALGVTLAFALLAAALLLIETSRRLREQQEREAALQLQAREVELRALKAHLRPHFLFNVLNSIYALIETRPAEAQRMVELVGDLLRRTLEAANDRLAPLDWELECAECYLAIEKVRLGERLAVEIDVEPGLTEVPVPPLVLQPLVENSIKHGIARDPEPGSVRICARKDGQRLALEVRNSVPNGSPRTGETPRGTGRGLEITRARLEALYGKKGAELSIEDAPSSFAVRMTLPLAAPAAPEDGR